MNFKVTGYWKATLNRTVGKPVMNTFAANNVPCKVRLVLKQLFDLYPMMFSANLFDQKVQQFPSCSIIVVLHVAVLFRPTPTSEQKSEQAIFMCHECTADGEKIGRF